MKKGILMAVVLLGITTIMTGCLPSKTIIVRFEDMKADLFSMEQSLQSGEWYKVDTDQDGNMIIHLYSMNRPSPGTTAFGAFQIAETRTSTGSPATVAASEALDLKTIEITEAVKQIMVRRQGRYSRIMELKREGRIGESNDGLIAFPPEQALTALSNEDQKIVKEENADRIDLLKEILRQKSLELDKLPRLQRQFAEVQYAMTAPGLWVQKEDASWIKIPQR